MSGRVKFEILVADRGTVNEVELPFRLLVIGDFTFRANAEELGHRHIASINKENFDQVMGALAPEASIAVRNELSETRIAATPVILQFRSLIDFSPKKLISVIPGLIELRRLRELVAAPMTSAHSEHAQDTAHASDSIDEESADFRWPLAESRKEVIRALLWRLEHGRPLELGDIPSSSALLADIDAILNHQLCEVLHHPDVMAIESMWRSLRLLVDRTDFSQNIEISLMNVTKEELLEDFQDYPDIAYSSLYDRVYTREYGQFGGKPYAAVICAFEIGHQSKDITLLTHLSAIGRMAHIPVIAAASNVFFGGKVLEGFAETNVREWFQSPVYARWNSFRDSPSAAYVGLVLPRMLLRQTYDEILGSDRFRFSESAITGLDTQLWGNPSFMFAACLTASFARERWCRAIVGPDGGMLADLVVDERATDSMVSGPLEQVVTQRLEYELSREGFIAFCELDGARALAFSANSAKRMPNATNSTAGLNESQMLEQRFYVQLPFVFMATRIAHYIKMLQQESRASWSNRKELEDMLNKWLRRYVADSENPPESVRATRPFRQASVKVRDDVNDVNRYLVKLSLLPHYDQPRIVRLNVEGQFERHASSKAG